MNTRRIGSVVEVKPDKIDHYKQLHAEPWPDVLAALARANIRNYSIYLRRLPDGKHYLFSYFEYAGDDFDSDMAGLGADPVIVKWWDVCKPCHTPLPDREEGAWWAEMEEVFHTD